MDLFEDYNQLPDELKAVLDKWQQKEASFGLDYKNCQAFQEECEAVGYTFDYQLDAQPFDLRPISSSEKRVQGDIDHHQNLMPIPIRMNLSWYDKYITPLSQAYKDFIKEMEKTSSELFFRDGERKLTAQEKKFLQIYAIRNIKVDSEAAKQKFIADTWAKELSDRTELSAGLTSTQIDERQAHYYRNYELEAKKAYTEINPFIENPSENLKSSRQLDRKENALSFDDVFSEKDLEENLIPASKLPDGWAWNDYDDGSGSLKSPAGYRYYSYDLQTQEYRLPHGRNEWTSMKDFDDAAKSLNEFKSYAEKDLKEKAATNNLSPKLSDEEKKNLLCYRILNKENKFILENLHITADQKKAYAEKMEFGVTNGDYSLTKHQLNMIPDAVDGRTMSNNEKYELAFGLLEKKEYGESYRLLENGEILKTYLDEDSLPSYKKLTVNNIKFNDHTKIMETQKDFDQVQYLKDQMKYLGFGEGEQLHNDLEKGIAAKTQQFEIKTGSDKASPGNHVDFTLKFNKTERGGVFLNSYHAKLTKENDEERSHNFPVSRDSSFTAKESINLLEGRSVKIEFLNPKTEQIEPAFVQFNFNEQKTEKGNYYFQNFYKNYGVDTDTIVEKSNLVFDKPEWKDSTIKSLEKGNIVKVKFKKDDFVIEGKAVLDPQNRNLKLYDNDMNRLNTNKLLEGLEQDHKHEKNHVKEQSIKR